MLLNCIPLFMTLQYTVSTGAGYMLVVHDYEVYTKQFNGLTQLQPLFPTPYVLHTHQHSLTGLHPHDVMWW